MGLHSCDVPNSRAVWHEETHWAAAASRTPMHVAIDDMAEFNLNSWFRLRNWPTCRAVAMHSGCNFEADLSYPVILSSPSRKIDR